MAITGEIDLTQGLDFFRHKELPSIIPRVLPWVKEKIGRSSIVAHTGYLSPVNTEEDLSLSSNSRITFTNRYSTTIRVNYNINTISNTSYSDNFDSIISWYNNTYSNSSSITTTISYNNSDTYITCDLNNVNGYIDTDNAYIVSNPKRLETDTKFHLGDIREKKDYSPATRRCGYCGKRIIGRNYKCDKCAIEYWHPVCKIYPWDKKQEKDTEFDYVPWSQKLTLKRKERIGSNLRKIPWLNKLESRIFGYYEEELRSTEEVDNSLYLTNMGWLGINEQSGRPRYTIQQETEAIELNLNDSDIVIDDTALFVSA